MVALKSQRSLAQSFVVYILLFSTFAAIVSTVIQLFFEYRRDISVMEDTARLIEISHQTTLSQALWTYDLVMLESQLKGIIEFPGVLYAGIQKDVATIAEAGLRHPDAKNSTYSYDLQHQAKDRQTLLGTLVLKFSLSDVYGRLLDRVVIILITQTLKTLFVSFFILLLFHFMVGRHLRTMADFAAAINLDNLHGPLLILNRGGRKKKTAPDELDLVESAMNKMKSKLLQQMENVQHSQMALQQSEERYNLAMRFASDGLWDWNMETNEVYFSPGWKRMLGYEDHEIRNEFSEWEQRTWPEDVAASQKMLKEVIDGLHPRFEKEFKMQHKNGHWVDVLSRANIVRDRNNRAVRLIGTHVDISRIKQVENDLRSSEKKFAKAFQAAPMMMSISAIEDGRYLDVNDAFVHHSGFTREMTIGNTSVELGFISPEQRARFIRELERSNRVKNMELSLKKADGCEFICLFSGEVIEVDGCQRLLSIALDITQQKKMEKQIQDSQKMESIGNLAGGIAHDFNNILFPIIGISDLLMEDLPLESPERKSIEEIHKAGKRGSELVKQILAFSRQSKHQVMPVRVQNILKEVLKLSRATIPANIEIHQDIQADCNMVSADPTQIHQVAMNIMTNAYHAVGDGGGRILVTLNETRMPNSNRDGTDRYVCLSISDTGHGISQEIMDKIFDPYFTTKAQGKGTGLGLAVVHGIIKAHKGEISVESEPGKGTTVTIYLPVMETFLEPEPIGGQSLETGNERILLVDDEEPIVRLVTQVLERLGYLVTAHTSSAEALATFSKSPDAFDLVISDMTMPQYTGDQLTSEIKAIRPDIPVIICTGFSERINEERVETMGFSGILMKPVVRSELSALLRKVLDKRSEPKELPNG